MTLSCKSRRARKSFSSLMPKRQRRTSLLHHSRSHSATFTTRRTHKLRDIDSGALLPTGHSIAEPPGHAENHDHPPTHPWPAMIVSGPIHMHAAARTAVSSMTASSSSVWVSPEKRVLTSLRGVSDYCAPYRRSNSEFVATRRVRELQDRTRHVQDRDSLSDYLVQQCVAFFVDDCKSAER